MVALIGNLKCLNAAGGLVASFATDKGRGRLRSPLLYCIFPALLLLFAGCARQATSLPGSETANQERDKTRLVDLTAKPFAEMLPQLHPDNRAHLLEFAASIPEPLPELASASSVFLFPSISLREASQRQVVGLQNGYAELQIGLANPGSNVNHPHVLCLRNGEQTSCTTDADVWSVLLPPQTIAFVPIHIKARVGDQLAFLIMPPNESERVYVASQMLWVFVEEILPPPLQYVEAPDAPHPVLGGCDYNMLLPDVSPADSFRIPATQERGATLELLLKPCDSAIDEYVWLIPVVDRQRVAKLPGKVWELPVKIVYPASVITVDTSPLGDAREFQIAIIPVNKTSADQEWLDYRFSYGVSFVD